jgi:hypothetical protein
VGLVRSQPAPIVFLDTCAILDLPRSFYRELASSSLVQMALKAIQASSATPSKLHLLIPEIVTLEYAKNLPETIQGLSGPNAPLLGDKQFAFDGCRLGAIDIRIGNCRERTGSTDRSDIPVEFVHRYRAVLRLQRHSETGRRHGSGNARFIE